MGRTVAQFGKRENPDSWGSLGFCFPCSRCQVPWTLPFFGADDVGCDCLNLDSGVAVERAALQAQAANTEPNQERLQNCKPGVSPLSASHPVSHHCHCLVSSAAYNLRQRRLEAGWILSRIDVLSDGAALSSTLYHGALSVSLSLSEELLTQRCLKLPCHVF